MAKAKFYTYIHRKADTGEVFYVGKGQKDRHSSHHSRSRYWKSIVSKHGFVSHVVAMFYMEADALSHEVDLIASMRADGKSLCNLTDGGEGCSGYVFPRDIVNARAIRIKEAFNRPDVRERRRAAISKSQVGRVFTDEHKMNLSKAHKGFRPSDSTRELLRNRTFSKEHVDAFMNATKDPVLNERRKQAISKTMKGHVKSEEHRAALSAAAKADWARRKAEKLNQTV